MTETVLIRMSAKAPCPEMGTPSLRKRSASLANKPNHIRQFVRCEADISSHYGLLQPNLRQSTTTLDMDMRRLFSIMADERQYEAPDP